MREEQMSSLEVCALLMLLEGDRVALDGVIKKAFRQSNKCRRSTYDRSNTSSMIICQVDMAHSNTRLASNIPILNKLLMSQLETR